MGELCTLYTNTMPNYIKDLSIHGFCWLRGFWVQYLVHYRYWRTTVQSFQKCIDNTRWITKFSYTFQLVELRKNWEKLLRFYSFLVQKCNLAVVKLKGLSCIPASSQTTFPNAMIHKYWNAEASPSKFGCMLSNAITEYVNIPLGFFLTV
jgi:hypothetical protein